MTPEQNNESAATFYDNDDIFTDDCCYECGDEGWIIDDCFEDTCCCADEEDHGWIPCPLCNPRGEA
jgi:hypothetical protein